MVELSALTLRELHSWASNREKYVFSSSVQMRNFFFFFFAEMRNFLLISAMFALLHAVQVTVIHPPFQNDCSKITFFFVGQLHEDVPIEEHPGNLTIVEESNTRVQISSMGHLYESLLVGYQPSASVFQPFSNRSWFCVLFLMN